MPPPQQQGVSPKRIAIDFTLTFLVVSLLWYLACAPSRRFQFFRYSHHVTTERSNNRNSGSHDTKTQAVDTKATARKLLARVPNVPPVQFDDKKTKKKEDKETEDPRLLDGVALHQQLPAQVRSALQKLIAASPLSHLADPSTALDSLTEDTGEAYVAIVEAEYSKASAFLDAAHDDYVDAQFHDTSLLMHDLSSTVAALDSKVRAADRSRGNAADGGKAADALLSAAIHRSECECYQFGKNDLDPHSVSSRSTSASSSSGSPAASVCAWLHAHSPDHSHHSGAEEGDTSSSSLRDHSDEEPGVCVLRNVCLSADGETLELIVPQKEGASSAKGSSGTKQEGMGNHVYVGDRLLRVATLEAPASPAELRGFIAELFGADPLDTSSSSSSSAPHSNTNAILLPRSATTNSGLFDALRAATPLMLGVKYLSSQKCASGDTSCLGPVGQLVSWLGSDSAAAADVWQTHVLQLVGREAAFHHAAHPPQARTHGKKAAVHKPPPMAPAKHVRLGNLKSQEQGIEKKEQVNSSSSSSSTSGTKRRHCFAKAVIPSMGLLKSGHRNGDSFPWKYEDVGSVVREALSGYDAELLAATSDARQQQQQHQEERQHGRRAEQSKGSKSAVVAAATDPPAWFPGDLLRSSRRIVLLLDLDEASAENVRAIVRLLAGVVRAEVTVVPFAAASTAAELQKSLPFLLQLLQRASVLVVPHGDLVGLAAFMAQRTAVVTLNPLYVSTEPRHAGFAASVGVTLRSWTCTVPHRCGFGGARDEADAFVASVARGDSGQRKVRINTTSGELHYAVALPAPRATKAEGKDEAAAESELTVEWPYKSYGEDELFASVVAPSFPCGSDAATPCAAKLRGSKVSLNDNVSLFELLDTLVDVAEELKWENRVKFLAVVKEITRMTMSEN